MMNDIPADRHRDPETMARLADISKRIFARHGVDFAQAHRAGGWSNATWLAGRLALRMAVETGGDSILREAQLAAMLPPEVGYPTIVETGVIDGYEWMLAQEVIGKNLEDCWPLLGWDPRITALRQLWAKAEAVHRVNVACVSPYVSKESPFYASTPQAAIAGLYRLQATDVLNTRQVAVLRQALQRFWAALPDAPHVLNHGDLSIVNALWHAGQVVTLLDFEFALVAPVELDLHELVKCAFAPSETEDPLPDPNGEGRKRLQQAVADIAVATVATPDGPYLLHGYAILLELWSMENWLSKWDGQESFTQWQPYQTLTSLADGRGGYLAPVLDRLSGTVFRI